MKNNSTLDELENKIHWARDKQKDLYKLVKVSEKLINQNKIRTIFTNLSNETYLASFISNSNVNKVTFNSLDNKHFKEWEGFSKCTFINKLHFKISIKPYDLVQFDCNHFIEDWGLFASNMTFDSTKIVILNGIDNVEKDIQKDIIRSFFEQDFFIHKRIKGYYGCLIMVSEKI
tara:strand:- start:20 stop:541 length:522 start_codon:yes stop_codon:yes gene_type:complete